MADFSFKTVKPLHPTRKRRRKRKAVPGPLAAIDTADAIVAIAKIIDPDAWGAQPVPSIDELQKYVQALIEDVEWMSATPTTPEGEDRLIRSEKRQQQRMSLSPMHVDDESVKERREMALAKAREAVSVYDGILNGQRRVLVKVMQRGRKPSFFMSRR